MWKILWKKQSWTAARQISRMCRAFYWSSGMANPSTWHEPPKLWQMGAGTVSISFFCHFISAYISHRLLASLRPVYGQTGILKFFLELIASKDVTESSLILHCLRLIGNSCADTGKVWLYPKNTCNWPSLDDNRATVVKDNYTSAIIRQLQRPELIEVVIPVIYNLCVDFGIYRLS